MGKRRNKKKHLKTQQPLKNQQPVTQKSAPETTDESSFSSSENLSLTSYVPKIKYDGYEVYYIKSNHCLIGYFGVFKTGKFNYVITEESNDFMDKTVFEFLKNFIKNEKHLTPKLNPKLYTC